MVAFAPVTFPLTLASDGCSAEVAMIIPAFPTAFAGAVTFGLPTLVVETLFRLPGRLWDRAAAPPADRPAPELQPDPPAPYPDWPDAREVPN